MELRTWRRMVLTAAVMGACAAPAAARQAPPGPPTETLPVQPEEPSPAQPTSEEWVSWNLPGWTFTPGVSLAGVFDSNVGLADAPAATGRTESDGLFLIQPFGRLEYNSPRTVFSTGYRGSLRRYTELRQLDGYNQRVTLSLRRHATRRVMLFVTNNFIDVPTTDEVMLNGVPFSRTGARTNSATGGLTARLTPLVDLSAQYENVWVTFDKEPDTFLGSGIVHGGRVGLSRRLSARLAVGGQYALRLASVNEGTRELTFQDIGGTATYAMGPRTTLNAAAGMSHLRDRTLDTVRTGPFFRAGLVHGLDRATVGVNVERSFVPSFGFGGSTRNQEVSGYIRMPLASNRAYVQGSAAWRRSDPFIETDLQLDTIWLRTTAGYSVARWIRAEVFYAYNRQDSIVTGGEIDRHRVGFQVVMSQPMRMR